ncbi:MAG TPA: BON domain-containing protein [Caulobacteraceae bacterium]|jgi:osmotically-inducible protein OsmY
MDQRSAEADASQISDEITHALHRSWFFDPQTITVSEADGVVRLTGTVPTQHDRRRAAIAAWSHPGVMDVINEIKIS